MNQIKKVPFAHCPMHQHAFIVQAFMQLLQKLVQFQTSATLYKSESIEFNIIFLLLS